MRAIAPALLGMDGQGNIGRRLRREGVGEAPPRQGIGEGTLESEKKLVPAAALFLFLNKVPKST